MDTTTTTNLLLIVIAGMVFIALVMHR